MICTPPSDRVTDGAGALVDVLGDLGRAARFETYPRGSCIAAEGEPGDPVTVLVDGEVDVLEGGRLVGVMDGPRVLEMAAALRGAPTRAGYRAATSCTAVSVPVAALSQAQIERALLVDIDDLRRARAAHAAAADGTYLQPGARLSPGPFRFGPFTAHLCVLRADPRRLAALLPAGVHLMPWSEGRYLLAISAIEGARVDEPGAPSWAYREVTPLVPCLGPGARPCAFIPELYPDSTTAILLGREIYGFPKRPSRHFARPDGLDVVVDQARLLRARWSRPRPLSVEALGGEILRCVAPPLASFPGAGLLGNLFARLASRVPLPAVARTARVLVHKRVLSASSSGRPVYCVDELVEVPFVVDHVGEAMAWDAFEVELAPGQPILTGAPLAVWSVRIGFRFGAGATRGRRGANGARS